MNPARRVRCAIAVVMLTCTGAATTAQPRTTADGVFTDAQAARGAAVFGELCVSCHPRRPDAATGSLSGAAFVSRWRNHTVDQLLERVRLTMPENAPGSLTPQAAVDVTAYLLHVNGAPAGTVELHADAGARRDVRIEWSDDRQSN